MKLGVTDAVVGLQPTILFTVKFFNVSAAISEWPCLTALRPKGRRRLASQRRLRCVPFVMSLDISRKLALGSDRFGSVPVLVKYLCQNHCSPSDSERRHNDLDAKKRENIIEDLRPGEITRNRIKTDSLYYLLNKMMNVEDKTIPWGVKWRAGTSSFRTVSELFSKRNLWALATCFEAIEDENIGERDVLTFGLNSIVLAMSMMQGYNDVCVRQTPSCRPCYDRCMVERG